MPVLHASASARPRPAPPRENPAEIAELLDELRISRAYTVEVAGAMPQARYSYRPHRESRSFGQQMVHIGESMAALYELFIEEKEQPTRAFSEAGREPVPPKSEVLAQLRRAYEYVETAAARLQPAALDKVVKTFGDREMTKRRVFRFMLDHATHHRSQSIVYLRINGVRAPQYRS